MDAIVTAGGIPRPEDPLYKYSHGDSKALIDIAHPNHRETLEREAFTRFRSYEFERTVY